MGFGGFGGFVRAVVSIGAKVMKVNPIVALVATVAISWIFRPKKPEVNDFGTTAYDDFEKGLLINKQSNDATIPVVYLSLIHI